MEHGEPETYGFTFTDKTGKVVAFSADKPSPKISLSVYCCIPYLLF